MQTHKWKFGPHNTHIGPETLKVQHQMQQSLSTTQPILPARVDARSRELESRCLPNHEDTASQTTYDSHQNTCHAKPCLRVVQQRFKHFRHGGTSVGCFLFLLSSPPHCVPLRHERCTRQQVPEKYLPWIWVRPLAPRIAQLRSFKKSSLESARPATITESSCPCPAKANAHTHIVAERSFWKWQAQWNGVG